MPTYDYRCTACGHEFELFHSMSEKPRRKCPQCEKNALERLIGTGAGIIFKGSGFYETDYRSDSYKKAAEADKKAASGDSSSKGETKTDAKPEKSAPAKPETKPAKAAGSDKPSGSKKKAG